MLCCPMYKNKKHQVSESSVNYLFELYDRNMLNNRQMKFLLVALSQNGKIKKISSMVENGYFTESDAERTRDELHYYLDIDHCKEGTFRLSFDRKVVLCQDGLKSLNSNEIEAFIESIRIREKPVEINSDSEMELSVIKRTI